jgi:hypothetical protein
MNKIFLTFLLITTFLFAKSQSLTLYNMEMIGQSTQINPSLMPANKMYIGIPMLSSTSFLFTNSGFTWRDLHRVRRDDSISIEIEHAISKLAEKNFISLAIRSNIVETGFHVKKTYFTFNILERVNFNMTFPKELFELAYKGNGAFIGQEIDLKRMAFDATHYREYAIGFARELSKKVTVGGKAKYLYGMENFSSAKTDLTFYTAPDDYQLELSSDYVVNTSSGANSEGGESGNYLFGLKNSGLGADVSVTYKYNESWKFNASIIDMGYIKWKSNVKNYTTASGKYTFNGIDLNQFMSDSSSSFDNVMDSISESFQPKETEDAFTTTLTPHYYLNAAYLIDEKMTVTGLLHAQIFRSTVQPTFTAAINRRFSNHFSAVLSYSMINHHFNNLGTGLVVHVGAVQFYMISDNIIGTINPLSNNTSQLQFGFNLIYGRPKKAGTKA